MPKFLPILILFPLFSLAQTDSIVEKLAKYRTLYNEGRIDSHEYSQLKKELFVGLKKPDKNELKKGKTQLAAGGILFGAGSGLIIGGLLYRPEGGFFGPDASDRKTARGFMIGTGAVCSLAGIILISTGAAKLGRNRKANESKDSGR